MNIVFQRKNNIFGGFWHLTKNSFSPERGKIKFTPTLILLSIILFGLIVFLYTITSAPLSGLVVITIAFILIEIFSYFLATTFSSIYRVNSITLSDEDIIFVNSRSQLEEKISYQNIEKLYYYYNVTMGVAGAFLGRALSAPAFWLQYYGIEYKDINGENQKLIIPPDLPDLSKFLKTIIEKLGLKRIQPNKLSLLVEWQKSLDSEISQLKENHSLSPSAIDPNADIGKLVLVVSIIIIAICYFIFRFLM